MVAVEVVSSNGNAMCVDKLTARRVLPCAVTTKEKPLLWARVLPIESCYLLANAIRDGKTSYSDDVLLMSFQNTC